MTVAAAMFDGRTMACRPRRASVVLLLLLLLAQYPAWALSDAKAAKIGKEMYDEITASIPVYDGQSLNEYVTGVGQRIVEHSDLPDGQFTFTVLDSPDINAFATPGGYIYINRGLLPYMNSEAQLAAVLAHEVAHVTEDHASRQQRAQIGSNVIAGLLAVLTGSGELGEATAMWGAATVRGYGREMELEADAVGARFLSAAGYSTQAMIDMISQLKDHERFSKQRAVERGKKPVSYHGLFSTHPRNDKRLRELVSRPGPLTGGNTGVVAFRKATEGLPLGQGASSTHRKEHRYYDTQGRFTLDYPEGWSFQKKDGRIVGEPEDKSAMLTLEAAARTRDDPQTFIKKSLGIDFIRKSEPLVVARLKGHSGVVTDQSSGRDTRLAVIYYGYKAHVFKGIPGGDATLEGKHGAAAYDDTFKSIIASFRPWAPRRSGTTPHLHYVKAKSGATYAKLATVLQLGRDGADELRLMNGQYPGGEPESGQWIKIIRLR